MREDPNSTDLTTSIWLRGLQGLPDLRQAQLDLQTLLLNRLVGDLRLLSLAEAGLAVAEYTPMEIKQAARSRRNNVHAAA